MSAHPSSAALRQLADTLDRFQSNGIEVARIIASIEVNTPDARRAVEQAFSMKLKPGQHEYANIGTANLDGLYLCIWGHCSKVWKAKTEMQPVTVYDLDDAAETVAGGV